ncbi:V-set and immunoglobulin domain-containing protein 10-like 2 [Varanus komodoensis]|nr:V-set and immunoglobulin domain-containing protein 10-like 2 [Varanus komodoensis]
MIVATVASLLVFQYIVRNRANNPRLHDLLFRMAGAEAREHISTPEDAETAADFDGEPHEPVGAPSGGTGDTLAGASQEEAITAPEGPTAAQEDAPSPPSAPEPAPAAATTVDDDPVNVTITVTATP